ncbi:mechanosensitive ion channel family protein [Lyngbya sp. PCC 8106]|uniref:mechanosensitive ion channel family protein n=1 Tax=Lyngbya sp. (strain PCC 8106) TaxID=313612 RepID=UPI0005871863|nr:mechanosensitive ion channel domain-containing protein [Lyngbya sp. PCC 8106]
MNQTIYFLITIAICFLLQIVSFSPTSAQLPVNSTQETAPTKTEVAVKLGGKTLFEIRAGVGSFSPEERAKAVTNRLFKVAEDPTIAIENIQVDTQPLTTNITVGKLVLVTITDADARMADQSRELLAESYQNTIQTAIAEYRLERSPEYIRQGVIRTVIATGIFLAILILFRVIFPWLYTQANNVVGVRIPAIRIQNFELLQATQISQLLTNLLKLLRLFLTLAAIIAYVTFVLSFFPWTKKLSRTVFGYFLQAAEISWEKFVSYLPNIFALAIIIFFTFYLIRVVRRFFTAVGNGTLTVQGFYPDWAEPTYKLLVFSIIILAAVIAFPYLPGFGSPAFQGISLFLGLLFSLGSTVIVANIVSGVILIYTRAFQIGDRIKIADTTGDVLEKTLFVTRIRTVKNVIVTLPNSSVFTSEIINYSMAESDPNYAPLILHTTITLGYDVPWRTVHEVLIDAAYATQHILSEPKPFVLQTSLDDFYVSYELNTYTNHPSVMANIYSELHQNIQDKCNETNIEILSPHYSAMRDGNQTTIPENYLPKDYTAPSFKVSTLGNILNPFNNQG